MKTIGSLMLGLTTAVLFTVTAQAHIKVTVTCPDGTPLQGIQVALSGACGPVTLGTTPPGTPPFTDANGQAFFPSFGVQCVGQVMTVTALNGFVGSTTFTYPTIDPNEFPVTLTITGSPVGNPVCGPATVDRCWLTGGGTIDAGVRKQPIYSFGGNVNPGCSPTAGEGGNWNVIAHDLGLHFQGTAIEVTRCGGTGSKSPVTPFSFIEFQGTGTVSGVSGNSIVTVPASFVAHYEDLGEPGHRVDRLFLRVFPTATPATTLILISEPDGVSPTLISTGNLQLHVSSCP